MASKIEQAVTRAKHKRSPPSRLRGGTVKKIHPRYIPRRTLVRGAKVELEHTSDPDLAVEIAVAHISEDPLYYSKLSRMERRR